MRQVIRLAAAAALVAGIVLVGPGAGARPEAAQPEGASSSNIWVTLDLRGAPPPEAQFVVSVPGSPFDEYKTLTFTPEDLGPRLSIETDGGGFGEAVTLTESAGAAAITYACEATGSAQCQVHPDRVAYHFPGDQNSNVNVTITLSFGRCDGRAATVLVGEGDDPTAGADVILGTAGGETIDGLGGNDRICGGGGPDVIRGGAGQDRLFGNHGPDRVAGGDLADRVFGGAGNDVLLGSAGNDVLDGQANRDTCQGGPGTDQAPRCEVRSGIP